MKAPPSLLAITLISTISAAHAETLTFRGTALSACALIAPVDGTLALNSDLKSWATATPATISAINTAPATLSVTKPTDWVSGPAGSPPTTFTVSAQTTGVNLGVLSILGNGVTTSLSGLGTSQLIVSLGATASTPYRAGNYAAEVTVTCTVP
ncbi:hypothetical protein ACFQI3_08630 [Hansschlegelia quercus]|uniref:Spore coat protein U domain-containing protein n=1 Tax=Hansschlegelia quercus TaxID=2528245 RepID=A0A4Q9GQ92_9HYPH|nr:hypothetical protein [Hansschlegelia quercus]TBN54160.1 hypothetical protein EYR15_04715 [Hansschlegelia quercus]